MHSILHAYKYKFYFISTALSRIDAKHSFPSANRFRTRLIHFSICMYIFWTPPLPAPVSSSRSILGIKGLVFLHPCIWIWRLPPRIPNTAFISPCRSTSRTPDFLETSPSSVPFAPVADFNPISEIRRSFLESVVKQRPSDICAATNREKFLLIIKKSILSI